MNVLELGGKYHDRYGEKSMHAQREAQSTMGEPSRRWGGSFETEALRNRGQFGQGSRQEGKSATGLPDSVSTRLGIKG